jgi:hypothetical protein
MAGVQFPPGYLAFAVARSKKLSGTDKTSDIRTRLDQALVTDVHTAAVGHDQFGADMPSMKNGHKQSINQTGRSIFVVAFLHCYILCFHFLHFCCCCIFAAVRNLRYSPLTKLFYSAS